VKGAALMATIWVVAASPAQAAVPDPEVLLREIQTSGAKTVLHRLWARQSMFEGMCERIETGDPRWLEVARQLRSAADAAASLSLNYSVARAIPRQPERVLALIGNGFQTQDVCASPFIEPASGIAERYQREAIAAVERISDPKLSAAKSVCLVELRRPVN